jgi:hypothetical protein
MAAQGTTRSTNPPTPKRVTKSASSQSLNHLLNFSLPPRQSHQVQSLPRRSRRHGTTQGVWNKEREPFRQSVCQLKLGELIIPPIIDPGFVNAQYRFVMNPLGDYTVHFADPDMCVAHFPPKSLISADFDPTYFDAHRFFQWQDILQIIIPRSSALAAAAAGGGDNPLREEGHTTCPICLSPPTAPRMTKCGHVRDILRHCPSQPLTLAVFRRCSAFNAYCTIWVPQKIPSGPAVRYVLTQSTRSSSRAFTGILHLPTVVMTTTTALTLDHRLHQPLPTSTP